MALLGGLRVRVRLRLRLRLRLRVRVRVIPILNKKFGFLIDN